MKYCFVLTFALYFFNAPAQSVNFTHRTARLNIDDGIIAVPEIGGMHHMLITSPLQDIRLQVYNQQLDWQREQILPIQLSKEDRITILPFANMYYLYKLPEPGKPFFLWKIDASGKATDETATLDTLIKSTFKDSVVTCELFSQGNHLFLFNNLYYQKIRRAIATFVKTNSLLQQPEIKRYAYAYNASIETLEKIVIVPERSMLVLKKRRTIDGEHFLNVLKVNLRTNKINLANFRSLTTFNFPEVMYNSTDSSFTVHAQMSATNYLTTIIRNVFFVRLGDTLDQKTPPTTIKVSINEEMYGAFACVNLGNGYHEWLTVHGIWNSLYVYQMPPRILLRLSPVGISSFGATIINGNSFHPVLQAIDPHLQFISPPGDVRFSVIDKNLNTVQDTIMKYYKRDFIETAQYADFTTGNNNYLMVKEQFPSKGKGLILLSLNKQGAITSYPLRLYEKYHYSLPQLQSSPTGKVLMPYVYRGQVGLVNIKIEKEE